MWYFKVLNTRVASMAANKGIKGRSALHHRIHKDGLTDETTTVVGMGRFWKRILAKNVGGKIDYWVWTLNEVKRENWMSTSHVDSGWKSKPGSAESKAVKFEDWSSNRAIYRCAVLRSWTVRQHACGQTLLSVHYLRSVPRLCLSGW